MLTKGISDGYFYYSHSLVTNLVVVFVQGSYFDC